jgi:hypothetical protein
MLPGNQDTLLKKLSLVDSLIIDVENEMIQLQHSGTGQDVIRKPGKLLEKLGYLASAVAVADFRPADQHQAVYEELHKRWLDVKEEWSVCINGPVAEFIQLLDEREIGPVILKQ